MVKLEKCINDLLNRLAKNQKISVCTYNILPNFDESWMK